MNSSHKQIAVRGIGVGNGTGSASDASIAESKNVTKLQVPEPEKPVDVERLYLCDLEKFLHDYDGHKGLFKKLAGDSEAVKSLRTFVTKMRSTKDKLYLTHDDIYELILLLEKHSSSITDKTSAEYALYSNVKNHFIGKIRYSFRAWGGVIEALNALRYLQLDNAVNLNNFIQNLYANEHTEVILLLQRRSKSIPENTLTLICKNYEVFNQFFRTLRLMINQNCFEFLSEILLRPKISREMERVMQLLYRNGLKLNDNLKMLLAQDDQSMQNICWLLEDLEKAGYLNSGVLTHTEINLLYMYSAMAEKIRFEFLYGEHKIKKSSASKENFLKLIEHVIRESSKEADVGDTTPENSRTSSCTIC